MKGDYTISQDDFIIVGSKTKQIEIHKQKRTFDEVIEDLGFGRAQIEISIAVTLVLFTVLNETMGISFIIPAAQCDLNLSSSDKGLLSGATFGGIMISSMIWGYLADTRGRRLIMLHALVYSTLSTIAAIFAQSFTIFAICRFFTGFFAAGFSISLYAYIGEFNSNRNRATIMSVVCTSIGISAMLQPCMAMWILSYDWSFELYEGFVFRPWRLLLFTFTSTGIIAFLMLLRFPESPRFYMAIGENQKAFEVLQWIEKKNKKSGEKLKFDDIEYHTEKLNNEPCDNWRMVLIEMKNQIVPLLKRPYLVPFWACCVMLFGIFANVGGLALFLPDTLNQLRKSNKSDSILCEILQSRSQPQTANLTLAESAECDDTVDIASLIDYIYLGFAYFMGFVVLSFITKRFGRRRISIFTLVTSSLCGFLLNLVTQRYLIVILYSSFLMMSGVNVAMINTASVELFPTHLRAMAVCVSMLSGRLGTTIASYLIGVFIDSYCLATHNIMSSLTLGLAAVTLLIPDKQ